MPKKAPVFKQRQKVTYKKGTLEGTGRVTGTRPTEKGNFYEVACADGINRAFRGAHLTVVQ